MLRAEVERLLPPLKKFHNGIAADLVPCVERTLSRLPDSIVRSILPAAEKGPVSARFIGGFDGSGSHKIFNQRDSLDIDSNNIIFGMCMYCLPFLYV